MHDLASLRRCRAFFVPATVLFLLRWLVPAAGSGAAAKLPQPPDLPAQRPPLLDPVRDGRYDPCLSEGSLGRRAGRRFSDQSHPRY
jgi:hypothetical protein